MAHRALTLLAAALAVATIPHAACFSPLAIAPIVGTSTRLGSVSHRSSGTRPLAMAAASAESARAALLTLAEAGPKNGVKATKEQVCTSGNAEPSLLPRTCAALSAPATLRRGAELLPEEWRVARQSCHSIRSVKGLLIPNISCHRIAGLFSEGPQNQRDLDRS